MKKRPMHVVIHAREPSQVEVIVGERVQLDRLARSPHGYLAERHGPLLERGATTVDLAPGDYFFKTLSDARLRVVRGGASARVIAHDKDPFPDAQAGGPKPITEGDEPAGDAPSFRLE